MLSFSVFKQTIRFFLVLAGLALLSACQFQPMHGSAGVASTTGGPASVVSVAQVNSRVGQQVRNHLIFLLNGGWTSLEKTHEARLRVSYDNRQLSAIPDPSVKDTTAGTVTVSVTYDLVDLATGKAIANGQRIAFASYDRTGQVFANERAQRDAENRAAREAAEALRLAIALDLNREQG